MGNYRALTALLAILTFLLMFLVVPALTFGADLRVGAWYDSPHSDDVGRSLDPSVDFSASVENRWVGLGAFYHSRDAQSVTVLGFAKPSYTFEGWDFRTKWFWESISIYPILGAGFDTHDGGGFAYVYGAGIDFHMMDKWSVGVQSQHIQRLDSGCYRMKLGLSVKYEF